MVGSDGRGTTMSSKTRPTIAAVIAAVAMLALIAGGTAQPAVASAQTPTPSCSGTNVTFTNALDSPIWLGEEGSPEVAPPNNDWKIKSKDSVDLCLPNGFAAGAFWARTDCEFNTYYGKGSCTTDNDCSGSKVCYAGKCVPNCSSPNNTNDHCINQFPGKPKSAICVNSKYCTVLNICATGDCSGQYQCTDGPNAPNNGPLGPTSLFEPTVRASDGTIFYDVSLASGYNVPIKVDLSVTPSGTCQTSGCVTDLDSTCSEALQVTADPTSTKTNIPCGTGYCQSGACNGNNKCVIGCADPGDTMWVD